MINAYERSMTSSSFGSASNSVNALLYLSPVDIVEYEIYNAASSLRNSHAELSSKANSVNLVINYFAVNSSSQSQLSKYKEFEAGVVLLCNKHSPKLVELSDPASKSAYERDVVKERARYILAQATYIEESSEREASRYLMAEVETRLHAKDLNYINELLININLYDLKPRALVSVLRSTYRAKNYLPRWEQSFIYTEERLDFLGLSSTAWLMGLNNASE